MSEVETTFRLVLLSDRDYAGQTAISPQLAKLVPGELHLVRDTQRLGMERTDWVEHFGKPKIARTVLIEAESHPGEWEIGADAPLRATGKPDNSSKSENAAPPVIFRHT